MAAATGARHNTEVGRQYFYYDSWLDAMLVLMDIEGQTMRQACVITREYTHVDPEHMEIDDWRALDTLLIQRRDQVNQAANRANRMAEDAARLPIVEAVTVGTAGLGAPGHWAADPVMADQILRTLGIPDPRLIPIIPPAVRPEPRVRVIITRIEATDLFEYECRIRQAMGWETARLPNTRILRPFLPPNYRRSLRLSGSRYPSERHMNAALASGEIPIQIMADAIKAYFISRMDQGTRAEAVGDIVEDTALMRMQPATLIVGGAAYRLVPTGAADLRNPLRTIRRQALESARAKAVGLTEAANRDARTIVLNAESQVRDLRERLEIERQNNQGAPPWLLGCGRPFRRLSDGRWEIIIGCRAYLRDIFMSVSLWELTLHWTPLPVAPADTGGFQGPREFKLTVCVNPDGGYSYTDCRAYDWRSPHITKERTCMELQDVPRRLQTPGDIERLEATLGRGMEVINMCSLLSSQLQGWHPFIVSQLPPGIIRLMGHSLERSRHWPNEMMINRADWVLPTDWSIEVPFETERQETFRIP